MKARIFKVDEYQTKSFNKAIRDRFDILELWMESIKLIINYYPTNKEIASAEIHIYNSKMSRLFYSSDTKKFSVAFPFRIEENEGTFSVKTTSSIDIDSKLSSEIISIVNFIKNNGLSNEWTLAEHFENQGGASSDFWPILSELLNAEDGYLRFDHDPASKNGHKHPLNHADLFYTNGASFKIGLHKKIALEEIIDILDQETDCHYLDRVIDRK